MKIPMLFSRLYEKPFGETVTLLSGFILFFMMIVGIVLNAVTVAVITKYKELRFVRSFCVSLLLTSAKFRKYTARNFFQKFVIFIFSLCVSDLIDQSTVLVSSNSWI